MPESEIGPDCLPVLTDTVLPLPESEDCLFLNVWTPGVGAAKKRPVMVWLHGGGYSVPVPPQVCSMTEQILPCAGTS